MYMFYILGVVLLGLGIIHLIFPSFLRGIGPRFSFAWLEKPDRTQYEIMNRISGVGLIIAGIVAIVIGVVLT